MQKLTILRLLTSSFLLFLIVSCATNPIKDFAPAKKTTTVFTNPYFSDPLTDYVYKANLSVYGNELSGIFIAKKINSETHRVVFTTEFGNKLLDFEISEKTFKINYIVEDLNRKMLINILKDDFRLLLKKDFLVSEEFEDKETLVLKSNEGNNNNYLFVNKADNKFFRLMHATARKEKINITFSSENNIFADRIIIQHHNIKLRIEFNFLENQPKQTP